MRYERKYKIDNLNHRVVEQSLRVHPAGLRKIYPDRTINNIYFDTVHLKNYHDNVEGVSLRQKVRIRWYGENTTNIKTPNLEIKHRHNEVGRKDIIPVPNFELYQLKTITKITNDLLPQITRLMPVLVNAYRRSYYGTSDGKYRLTIDRDLQYFSLINTNRFTRFNIKEDAVVLEIKYDQEYDNLTDRITQFLPFRQTKSSKYVTGVLMTF